MSGESSRTEEPALELKQVAVCLHLVQQDPVPDPGSVAMPAGCNVFGSMERDLLAYCYQIKPPFVSACVSRRRIPLMIRFPPRFEYHSEGRTITLECPYPDRPADVIVSVTRYPHSGISVWHLSFAPPATGDGAFSEFDIIKLIHLYDGRSEQTSLAKMIRFNTGGGAEVGIEDLLAALGVKTSGKVQPMAGTIEIIIGSTGDPPHAPILEAALNARTEDGCQAHASLVEWIDGDSPEGWRKGRILEAYCGIVTGIFDFDEISVEEVLDTLEPTYSEQRSMIRVHRCTVTNFAQDRRLQDECNDVIGINPYLIIPHALLLHNEALITTADGEIDTAMGTTDNSVDVHERHRGTADRALHRLTLPNVFQYVTERTYFERGWQSRGNVDRRDAVRAKLNELSAHIHALSEYRRDMAQRITQALLAVIAVLQIKEIVFALLKQKGDSLLGWGALIALALAIVTVVLMAGITRRSGK